MPANSRTAPQPDPQALAQVQVHLLTTAQAKARARQRLAQHHYLGDVRAVGEQLWYAVPDAHGHRLGGLVFCTASRRLRPRDPWIGWTDEQRRRRLPLLVNNCRFLLLPHKTFPNLGSRCLRLALERLSADGQARYGHPVVLVETFVDPQQFCGTVYTAQGWQELGPTEGFGRVRRDFYVQHHRPKRLFVRELSRHGRRSLAAERLPPALAAVEAMSRPRSRHRPGQIRSLIQHLKTLPDYRARVGLYPLWSLVAICVLAHLCGAPRGQKDLAAFAQSLSQPQRRALGIRRQKDGTYPAPSQPTFCRLFQHLDPEALEPMLLQVQEQIRGPASKEERIVLEGKQPHQRDGPSGRRGHGKRSAPALGRLAPGRRLPGASARGDPSEGDVAALQQQSLYGMALAAEEASTQDEHGLLGVMKAEHYRYALRCLQARPPSLPPGS